jgi:valyl-tRNA synthetase
MDFFYFGLADKEAPDLKAFHPTDVMETGYDILFFWVARMILMSTYHTGQIPFKTVYLHGLVRDKDRQKMSKSKGNVIDPLGVIDTFGTDALRFALIFSSAAGNDIPLAEDKIKGMKHFANKLWNISRYVLSNVTIPNSQFPISNPEPITQADKEILAKLDATIKSVTNNLNTFNLHEAAQSIYQFTWREFADVYIEASKPQLTDASLKQNTQAILLHCLISILKLLHPFMPFVTEELWSKLREEKLLKNDSLLIVADWPKTIIK